MDKDETTQPEVGECDVPPSRFVPCRYCHGARWVQSWATGCWPCLDALPHAQVSTYEERKVNPDWINPEFTALRAQLATVTAERDALAGQRDALQSAYVRTVLAVQPKPLVRCNAPGLGPHCYESQFGRPDCIETGVCKWIDAHSPEDFGGSDYPTPTLAAQPNTGERVARRPAREVAEELRHAILGWPTLDRAIAIIEADRRGEP